MTSRSEQSRRRERFAFYRRVPPFVGRREKKFASPDELADHIRELWRECGHTIEVSVVREYQGARNGRIVSHLIAGLPPDVWAELWGPYEAIRHGRCP